MLHMYGRRIAKQYTVKQGVLPIRHWLFSFLRASPRVCQNHLLSFIFGKIRKMNGPAVWHMAWQNMRTCYPSVHHAHICELSPTWHRENCRPPLLSRARMETSPYPSYPTPERFRFIYRTDSESPQRRRCWSHRPDREGLEDTTARWLAEFVKSVKDSPSSSRTRRSHRHIPEISPVPLRYVPGLDLISDCIHALIWFPSICWLDLLYGSYMPWSGSYVLLELIFVSVEERADGKNDLVLGVDGRHSCRFLFTVRAGREARRKTAACARDRWRRLQGKPRPGEEGE